MRFQIQRQDDPKEATYAAQTITDVIGTLCKYDPASPSNLSIGHRDSAKRGQECGPLAIT
ncbi:hypothetical protein NBRC116601_17340 [Cognatishimia sp. WU-CL00825]